MVPKHSTFDGVEPYRLFITSNEATLGHSILELVRGTRIRRDVCLDRTRDSRHRTAPHGRRKSDSLEWLHIAAPLVAVIGCLMASIAYGLATRKAWSRHLVMVIFVLIIVYASALGALNVLRHTIMWRAIVTPLCLVVRAPGTSTSNQTLLSIFANSEGDRCGHGRIFLALSYCAVEAGVRNAEA